MARKKKPAYVGNWANISDKFNTTFYTWIVIHGYGRTRASGPVERLESLEFSLIKPIMRFTATTTHQKSAQAVIIVSTSGATTTEYWMQQNY